MVIQKGLAALAMLAAFTIAAEGICNGQWTSVGSAGLYYTIKADSMCVDIHYTDGFIQPSCQGLEVVGPCNRYQNGPRDFVACQTSGGSGHPICIQSTNGNIELCANCYCPQTKVMNAFRLHDQQGNNN